MISVRTKILILCAVAPAVLIIAAAISVLILRVAHYYITNVDFHLDIAPVAVLCILWGTIVISAVTSFLGDRRQNSPNS